MKRPNFAGKIRLLDYLPADPRFDALRQLFAANELKRAEQQFLPLEPGSGKG